MVERIVTADLHTHLLEKKQKPEKYWRAVENARLDVVAITEHAEFNPKKAFQVLEARKPDKVLLIPGIELSTDIGHVLAFGETSELFEIPEFLSVGAEMKKIVEIAKKESIVLSIAHPWGFNFDSAYYVGGMPKLRKFVKFEGVGVEAFNAMIASIAEFAFKSPWVKKPARLFNYLEANRIARKTGIARLSGILKKKLDKRTSDLIARNLNAMEFGEEAEFITAGSDAHYADRIGTGILKLKVESKELTAGNFLKALKEKENMIWAGPKVEEVSNGILEKEKMKFRRKEILSGLSYATRKAVKSRIEKRRKKNESNNVF